MKPLSSIPAAPRSLPLMGHLLSLAYDPWAFFESLPTVGDLVCVRLGPIRAVVACNPQLTWQVLSHDRDFDKGGLIFQRAREVLGDGLVSCPHSRHRRQRRMLQPAFHPDRFPAYSRVMTDQISTVISSWQNRQVLDVVSEMKTITAAITMQTMFADTLPLSVLRRTTDDVSKVTAGIYTRTLIPSGMNLRGIPGNRRFEQARTNILQTVEKIVATRRTGEDSDRGDLLSVLLSTRDGDGPVMDNNEILDQIVTFLIGGTETTAAALAWSMYLLAKHPEVRDQLDTEVGKIAADGYIDHADLPRLEFTRRVVIETIRLWPPTWILTRTTTDDVALGDHHLPAGTTVIYSPYLIHRRPDIYEQPAVFDPDRWLPERVQAIPRHAYIAFGGGGRKCIGDTFGLNEATLALAIITANWRLEPVRSRRVRPARAITLYPKDLYMRAVSQRSMKQ